MATNSQQVELHPSVFPLRVHSFSSCTLCHFALQTTAPEVPVTILLCHLIKENVTSKDSVIPAPQKPELCWLMSLVYKCVQ